MFGEIQLPASLGATWISRWASIRMQILALEALCQQTRGNLKPDPNGRLFLVWRNPPGSPRIVLSPPECADDTGSGQSWDARVENETQGGR